MAKKFQNVAVLACMTILLMLFNLAFWAGGFTVMIFGIWMRLELQDYADMTREHSSAILLGLAGVGAIVALIVTFACCCTVRQHPALLYAYGVFLAIVALLEVGGGTTLYTYRGMMNESYDRALNESMTAYNIEETKTLHLDLLQTTLHCCGNHGFHEWQKMKKTIPESCCSVQKGECDTTDLNDIYTMGCFNRVNEFMKNNFGIVAGIAAGIAGFPLIGVILSCCLASYIKKVNVEDIA